MSVTLHGSPQRIPVDRAIREWLANNGFDVMVVMANELNDVTAMARYLRKIAHYLGEKDIRERIRNDRSWFTGNATDDEIHGLEFVLPTGAEQYVSAVPFIPLRAAAGSFGEPQYFTHEEHRWVRYNGKRRLRPGMFIAQVVGKSMEPAIPDGSYCLFSSPVEGSRNGKIVLVELRDFPDPETGERYTVKRYQSDKVEVEGDSWSHKQIRLLPANPEFQPITVSSTDEHTLRVIAELVEVIEA